MWDPKQRCKLTWKHQKSANTFFCRLHLVVLSTSLHRSHFLLQFWAPQGTTTLLHTLSMKSRKRLTHGVFENDATLPCSWYHRHTLLGTKWQLSLCFYNFQMSIFNKQDQKSSEKLLCLYFFLFLSNQQDLWCLELLVLFKRSSTVSCSSMYYHNIHKWKLVQ